MEIKITKKGKTNEDFRAFAKEFMWKATRILDKRFAPNAISLHVANFHLISLQALIIFY